MDLSSTAPPAAVSTVPVRTVTVSVLADYALSHLGMFAVMPVLPLLVAELDHATTAVFVGSALLVFNLTVRGGSLLLSGLLHASPVGAAMAGGLTLTAAAFALLAAAPGRLTAVVCLTLAGLGISINGLAARVYVAMTVADPSTRNTIFSAVQIVVNVAAALGPVASTFLVSDGRGGLLLLLVAALYLAAAVVVTACAPRRLRPRDGDVRPPLRLGLLAVVVRDRHVRRVSAATVTGCFLYAQLFSAFALMAAAQFASPGLRAGFFTANAVLVVLLQIPVTRHVNAALAAGRSPLRSLLTGVVLFAAACAVFGLGGTTAAGALAGVFVFSLAETWFTPTISTVYADLAGDRPVVEAFNLRQIAVCVGEAGGAFCGGAVFPTAVGHGLGAAYWAVLAAAGLAVAAAVARAQAPSGRARAADLRPGDTNEEEC